MTNKWKTIAIVFIILFTLETAFVIWGIYLVEKEEQQYKECAYEICKDYHDAWVGDDICSCYNEQYEIIKTTYMRK